MTRMHVHLLLRHLRGLRDRVATAQSVSVSGNSSIPVDSFRIELQEVAELCRSLRLNYSLKHAESFLGFLDIADSSTLWRAAERAVAQISGRVEDDLSGRIILLIDERSGSLFETECPFGQEVAIAFPSAATDLQEAARCYALERWTASVFHAMRAVELVLRTLAGSLGLDTVNPNWGSLLNKIDSVLTKIDTSERPPAFDDESISELCLVLRSIKNAWRNPVSHAGVQYGPQVARLVWCNVEGLFLLLAPRIQEPA